MGASSPTTKLKHIMVGFNSVFLIMGLISLGILIALLALWGKDVENQKPDLRACVLRTSGPEGYLYPIPTAPSNPVVQTPFDFNKVKQNEDGNWDNDDHMYKLDHEGKYSVHVHLNLQISNDTGLVTVAVWTKDNGDPQPIAVKSYGNNGAGVWTQPVDIYRNWDFKDEGAKVWVTIQSNNTAAFLVNTNYCYANVFEIYDNRA